MEDLQLLQEKLGIDFADPVLLEQSLVHRSFLNENPGFHLSSNERLEFLGDAILGFVAAEFLYTRFSDISEGQLTGLRAALVRTETLARIGRRLKLGIHLFLGKGEQASGGGERPLILASAFEAVVGAIYLDRGLETVRRFLIEQLDPELDRAMRLKLGKDFKSTLQELIQGRWQITPEYETVAVGGPDHAREFTVGVRVGARVLGEGRGRNKRQAEQEAARRALETLAAEE
ncbi:MAG: ribonuclease III [Chloroflexi bacterium]|nr:ribonuclease III [Chloroflexota bacterium]